MTQLVWNNDGERHFEVGVDRGVLYTSDGFGIAWNGLTSVAENPSGGEPTPYYLDGIKYLNVPSKKEFTGTIEAYMYPSEFAEYDGWVDLENGLVLDEQTRKQFGLSYRTRIGNDIEGAEFGYKIHLVYKALASPTASSYSSTSENIDPIVFSWDFTTMPSKALGVDNLAPLSHVVIDSTKTNPTQLQFIEEILYGKVGQNPVLPAIDEMLVYFANPMVALTIIPSPATGMTQLMESQSIRGDLKGRTNEGLYVKTDSSHLVEQSTEGLYILFNPNLYLIGA